MTPLISVSYRVSFLCSDGSGVRNQLRDGGQWEREKGYLEVLSSPRFW